MCEKNPRLRRAKTCKITKTERKSIEKIPNQFPKPLFLLVYAVVLLLAAWFPCFVFVFRSFVGLIFKILPGQLKWVFGFYLDPQVANLKARLLESVSKSGSISQIFFQPLRKNRNRVGKKVPPTFLGFLLAKEHEKMG